MNQKPPDEYTTHFKKATVHGSFVKGILPERTEWFQAFLLLTKKTGVL